MKTRIVILLAVIVIVICAAVPPPAPMRDWINSWTTNRGVDPVMGSNNLAITNHISGAGGGTSWNFYGISPNTVARLKDATNIANAAIASSNANYVLKFNGTSDGQMATNLTVINFVSGPADNLSRLAWSGGGTMFDIPILGGGDALTARDFGYDSGAFFYDTGPQLLHAVNQTNSGRLDVAGGLTVGGGVNNNLVLNGANVISLDSTLGVIDMGSSELKLTVGGIQFQTAGGGYFRIINSDLGVTPIWNVDGSGNMTNGGTMDVLGVASFYRPLASKLAAFDALHHLTNASIDETYVLSIQTQLTAATNALNVASNALKLTFNPNQFASAGGSVSLTNGFTGTNGQLISATNSPSASNQVAETILAKTGQVGDMSQWLAANGTTNALINSNGSAVFNGGTITLSGTTANEFKIGQGGAIAGGYIGIGYSNPKLGLTRNGGSSHFIYYDTGTGDTVMDCVFGGASLVFRNQGNTYGRLLSSGAWAINTNLNVDRLNVTNNVGIGTTTPAAKLDVQGNVTVTGGETNRGTTTFPTNNAPTTTIAPTGLHTVALGKGWTNDLGARADLILSVKLVDAVTGDPAIAFTNTVTGEAWTNNIIFGAVASVQYTITIPDLSPSDYGSFTDLSGTGASVTILNSWWKLK